MHDHLLHTDQWEEPELTLADLLEMRRRRVDRETGERLNDPFWMSMHPDIIRGGGATKTRNWLVELGGRLGIETDSG